MHINPININETWDFFYKSKIRNNMILKWGGIYISFVFLIILLYAAIFFIILASSSATDGDEAVLPLAGLSMIIMCCAYILMIGFGMLLGLYMFGGSIENYKYLRANYSSGLHMEDLPKLNCLKTIISGLRIYLIHLIYMIPIIFIYILWLAGFIIVMTYSMPYQEDQLDQFNVVFLLYYLSIYLVAGIVMLYTAFIMFVLNPIIYNTIIDKGYLAAANPIRILKIFSTNYKGYLKVGLHLLLPYAVWMGLYFATAMLIYLCIGIFALPFVLGLIMIIMIYIQPHIMAQAFHKKIA